MIGWLITALTISIAYNYFVTLAYIELNKKYSPYDEYIKEIEKIHGSLDKFVTKHKKTFKKGVK